MFRKIKKCTLLGLYSLGIGVSYSLSPPPAALAGESSGGTIYYSVGTQWLNTNSLNQNLKQAGYSQSDSLFWGQGFGINGMFQNFIMGYDYQSLFGQTLIKEQESLGISANYQLVQLGYLIIATPRFQLYPYLGTGVGQLQIFGTESLNNTLSVSQGSTPHLGRIQSQNWLVDMGLGTQVIIPMSPQNETDARGLTFGLKAGYLWQPLASAWQHNQLPMQGPEKINIEGFYLRFHTGFGGYK